MIVSLLLYDYTDTITHTLDIRRYQLVMSFVISGELILLVGVAIEIKPFISLQAVIHM